MEDVVPNLVTFPTWSLNDGVIKGKSCTRPNFPALTQTAEAFQPDNREVIDKGIFIRALAEARRRNPGTALAKYIESYILVQVFLSALVSVLALT